MKTYNGSYAVLLDKELKSPRVTIEISFDDDDTDLLHVTSHSDGQTPVGATNVVLNCIEEGSLSNQTQTIDIEKSTSTIGSLSFNLIDVGQAISTLMGTKENAGLGLRHKRVRVYSGFEGQPWDEYQIDATYIVDGISQEEGLYKFNCTDVNRLVRSKIFTVDTANLLSTIPLQEKTFSVSASQFTASDRSIVITPGTYDGNDFYVGMVFDVTGTVSNNGRLTVASVDSNIRITTVEPLIDETVTATIDHTLNLKITGTDLNKFQPIEHDGNYRYLPSDTVGILKIGNELFIHDGPAFHSIDGYSIAIRENGRAILDTTPEDHKIDSGVSAGDTARNPEVKEIVYLEGPAPKLALALLTGTLYGQSGTLPSHWNCNVPAKFIRTSDFVNIGTDIWNTATNSGRHLEFMIQGEKSGKDFIENQIMLWMGCFMPIYSDGALGIRKIPSMLGTAGYSTHIDDRVTYKRDVLKRPMTKVINKVTINWGKIKLEDKYTKTNVLIDADSITKHKLGTPRSFNFDGVRTGSHTDTEIINYLNSWRDLYSSPPYELTLTVFNKLLKVEPGDAVRVTMPQHRDIVNGTTFDRVMMVVSTRTNILNGEVRLNLIGPSDRPTPLEPPSSSVKLADGYYAPGGAATALTSVVTITAGVIAAGTTILTGSSDMNDLNSVFYYDGDLELPSTAELHLFDNVNLRIKGHFSINGKIISTGSSNLGGKGDVVTMTATDFVAATKTITVTGGARLLPNNTTIKVAGSTSNDTTGPFDVLTIDTILSDTQFTVLEALVDEAGASAAVRYYSIKSGISSSFALAFAGLSDLLVYPSALKLGDSGFGRGEGEGGILPSYLGNVRSSKGYVTEPDGGIGEFTRYLTITHDGVDLEGLPSKFTGSGGSGGRSVTQQELIESGSQSYGTYGVASGGDGGAGGAGLLITCRGASFAGIGEIDLTGESGTSGESGTYYTGKTANAGAGLGGNPGACYFFYDGLYTVPNIDGRVKSKLGITPSAGTRMAAEEVQYDQIPANFVSFYAGSQNFVYSEEDAYFQYLPESLVPVQETPVYTQKALSIVATEILNTPTSAEGTLSTIEVIVTEPSDTSYDYSNVYYRKSGDIEWTFLSPAASSTATAKVVQIVDSDGTTWEYLAKPVSLSGNESEDGKQTSIITTDVAGAPSSEAQLPIWLPLAQPGTLQLVGGGVTFTGRSVQFTWSYDGTDSPPPQHFDHYKVEVYDAAGADTLRRVVETQDPWFEYTEEMAIEDGGPYREVRLDVTAVGRKGHEGLTASTGAVTNAQSGLPSAIEIDNLFSAIHFKYAPPADPDWVGIKIYLSEVNGFTANADTLVYEGSDTSVYLSQYANGGVLAPVVPGTTYYLRYQTYDAFDQNGMTLSAQQSATPQSVNTGDISGLSNWATQLTPVDSTFINANMADDAVSSTQIASLVAGKISAGTISSQITISGLFRTSATGYRVDMGPVVDGTDTFVFRYHDGLGNDRFTIDDVGNVNISGTVTIGSTLASTIETNAANGATFTSSDAGALATLDNIAWDSGDLTGIPDEEIYNVDDATALGFNPSYSAWAGTIPDGWAAWSGTPTKETTIVQVGDNAVRWHASGANLGMVKDAISAFDPNGLPAGSFIIGSFSYYLVSYIGPGKPGLLVDLGNDTASGAYRTTVNIDNTTTGVWHRQTFVARVLPGEKLYGIRIYQIASYSGMSGGQNSSTIIFDNVGFNVVHAETLAYDDGTLITDLKPSVAGADITNKSTVEAAVNGDLTVTGTITGSKIITAAAGNDRIHLNEDSSNEMRIYSATNALLGSFGAGTVSGGADNILVDLGSNTLAYQGLRVQSSLVLGATISANPTSQYLGALSVSSNNSNGSALQVNMLGHGIYIENQGNSSVDTRAAICIRKMTSGEPSGTSAYAGSISVGNSGDMYYKKTDAGGWIKIPLGDHPTGVPTGTIIASLQSGAPTGFLKCKGGQVSRATYADLFALIGVTYGSGDGSTTFNLPDLRAEFLRGWDDLRGIDVARGLGTFQAQKSNNLANSSITATAGYPSSITIPEDGTYSGYMNYYYSGDGIRFQNRGGENIPRNFSVQFFIAY